MTNVRRHADEAQGGPADDHRAGATTPRTSTSPACSTWHRALPRGARPRSSRSTPSAAQASAAGVVAVFTGEDMADDFEAPLPMVWAPPGVEIKTPEHWPLSAARSSTWATPWPSWSADDTYPAVDAPTSDRRIRAQARRGGPARRRSRTGSPLVWEEFGTNKTHEWALGRRRHRRRRSPRPRSWSSSASCNHRTSARRSSRAARWPSPRRRPHPVARPPRSRTSRGSCCRACLRHRRGQAARDRARRGRRLRREAPDYARGSARAALSQALERPVKWIETRSEDMTTSHHGRDQINYVKLGAKRDGTVTG